jgi:hypothetical protein
MEFCCCLDFWEVSFFSKTLFITETILREIHNWSEKKELDILKQAHDKQTHKQVALLYRLPDIHMHVHCTD